MAGEEASSGDVQVTHPSVRDEAPTLSSSLVHVVDPLRDVLTALDEANAARDPARYVETGLRGLDRRSQTRSSRFSGPGGNTGQ